MADVVQECKTCVKMCRGDQFIHRSLHCKDCKNHWSSMARAAKKKEITAGYDWLKNHAPWTTAQATFDAFVAHKLDEEPLALFAWGDWIPERFLPVVAVPPPPVPQPIPQPPAADDLQDESEVFVFYERRVRRRTQQ
jgi:hypothetical protein